MKLKALVTGFFASIFAVVAVSAQTVVDSVVTITLPTVLDFSTVSQAFAGVSTLVGAGLTLTLGFWAKKLKAFGTYFNTTERKVAAVGITSALVVNFVFGFNKDAMNLLWQTLLGTFGIMGVFGAAKPQPTVEGETEA